MDAKRIQKKQLRNRRSVAFFTVTVHYHSYTLGDQPAVTSGPPISLFEHVNSEIVSIDEFEDGRPNETRRHAALKLDMTHRIHCLHEAGVSDWEMEECMAEIEHAREERLAEREREAAEEDEDQEC